MQEEVEDSFFYTQAGAIVPTITGSISFISSITTIFIILKSRQNSVYHRIIFLMSFFNSFTSMSIALTTLPMPKDITLPFQGPSYGSNVTCQIQGMVIIIGVTMVLLMNAVLMTYYQCSIVYGMTDATFSKKKIEPVLLFISLVLSIFFAVACTKYLYVGPSPNNPYCFISKYPMGCYISSSAGGDRPSECFQNEEEPQTLLIIVFGLTVCSVFIYTAVTMVSILTVAMKNRKELNRHHHHEQSLTEVSQSSGESINHRVFSEALMYIGAFLFTWCWPIPIYFVVGLRSQTIYWLQALRVCFQPLHGFYIFVIFFWHKVQNQRRSNGTENKSFCEIVKKIFTSPQDCSEGRVLTGLSLLDQDRTLNTMRRIGGRGRQQQQSDLSNEMELENLHDRSSGREESQSWVSSFFSIKLSRNSVSSP